MKTTQTLLAAAILLSAAGAANANLVSALGGQVVNDTDLNITWLADANYAKTSGYDADGKMTWSEAQDWITSLNAANYLSYSDWRLPTSTDIGGTNSAGTSGCNWSFNGTDCGYNSAGSEMSHLYYNEFGNKGYYNIYGVAQSGYGLVDDPAKPNDESLFTNLQSDWYWSTEYARSTNSAWIFNTRFGEQSYIRKDSVGMSGPTRLYALAVRDGQVVAAPVPAAAWLLGSGLLGLIGVARRKAA